MRQDVKELLGDDILFRSDWIVQQQGNEALVEVNASGKKAGGMFQCTLLKVDGTWKVMKLDVIYNTSMSKFHRFYPLQRRKRRN